jgi:hypothetical protein
VYTCERQPPYRPEKWLHGEEPHVGGNALKITNTVNVALILNAHPHPQVAWPIQFRGKTPQSIRALGEDLENVMICPLNRVEDSLDVVVWHVLMEEITHGVHEYHSGR